MVRRPPAPAPILVVMKILVTGANGQLGQALRRLLADAEHRADFTDRAELDLTDADAVRAYVRETRPDAIVNCAAYTAVDKAESEEALCAAINEHAVRTLAEAAAETDARLVHVSTDYVYHNGLDRPLRETDPAEPKSVYARTKLAGELAAREAFAKTVTLRTSWVYGLEGHNFLRTMQRLGAERDRLTVVSDQIGAPTFADDLAGAVLHVLAQADLPGGTYNYAGLGVGSWYDFATAIMEAYGLDCAVVPIMTSDYPTPAARPPYSVLDLTRARDAGFPLRHWRAALADFVGRETADAGLASGAH